MEIAQGIEAASKDVQSLNPSQQSVQLVQPKSTTSHEHSKSQSRSPCYRCGGTSHLQMYCRFKNVTCRGCGMKGHIDKVCRSRKHARHTDKPQGGKQVRSVTSEPAPTSQDSAPDEDPYYMCNTLKSPANVIPPIVVTIQLNDCPIQMEQPNK